ncbi:MAG: zinc-dependent alcohol dehydrogenase family protein [Synechococcales cyanobacterium K44_A2020_017]|nr:zinc-dependent alcohol dehydrogenase family protein [Synechococcales cyanobacterium K32_A2020_035]MBF2093677.1 zinc-dependent alcohol dehydrogenase family protein [Synechococcales cyanobacterium K44_A2020_017]
MKAVLMTAAGGPKVLRLSDVPMPTLSQPTDVLVRLRAAGINPIDTKLRQRGTFYPDQMPAILGCDGAGVVEAVGAEVRSLSVGDEVYFCAGGLGSAPGTYADYTVVDERYLAPKPKTLSFAEAAAAPLVLITAWEALYDRARLEAGRSVLVQAGAGGVGHVAIQLAHLQGAKVCTTVSTPDKADFVRQLGAELPILYPQTDVVQAVLDWTAGEGVDTSFDTLGGRSLSQCFAATAVYGDVVTLLAPAADADWKTARDRNLRVSYELMLTPMLKNLTIALQDQAMILRTCARLIDQGSLKIHLSQTFPLAEASQAHALIEQGSTQGKLALTI